MTDPITDEVVRLSHAAWMSGRNFDFLLEKPERRSRLVMTCGCNRVRGVEAGVVLVIAKSRCEVCEVRERQ